VVDRFGLAGNRSVSVNDRGRVSIDRAASSDEELLRRSSEGDRKAFRDLYERHAPWLILRLSRRCADPGVVEDVVQETFAAVWTQADRHRGTGQVAAWIWGIGIRKLIDRFRQQRRLPIRMSVLEPTSVEPSAEEQVLLGVQLGDLAHALSRLSPEFRAVIQATVLDGLTTREASRLLGIPQGTVKTRLMRARAQLRELLT
jgi:RNA polymerase sigma-70 factor, ECF subfamily